jgi:hypothetical protein
VGRGRVPAEGGRLDAGESPDSGAPRGAY